MFDLLEFITPLIHRQRGIRILVEIPVRILCVGICCLIAYLAGAILPDLCCVFDQRSAEHLCIRSAGAIFRKSVNVIIVLKIFVHLRNDLIDIVVTRDGGKQSSRSSIFFLLIQFIRILVYALTVDLFDVFPGIGIILHLREAGFRRFIVLVFKGFFRILIGHCGLNLLQIIRGVRIIADLRKELPGSLVVFLLICLDGIFIGALCRDLFQIFLRILVGTKLLELLLRCFIILLFIEGDRILITLLRNAYELIVEKQAGKDSRTCRQHRNKNDRTFSASHRCSPPITQFCYLIPGADRTHSRMTLLFCIDKLSHRLRLSAIRTYAQFFSPMTISYRRRSASFIAWARMSFLCPV